MNITFKLSGPVASAALGVNQSSPQLLSSYRQYHSIGGSSAGVIKHKQKELWLFIRRLSDQGHSMQSEHLNFLDAVGHLDRM